MLSLYTHIYIFYVRVIKAGLHFRSQAQSRYFVVSTTVEILAVFLCFYYCLQLWLLVYLYLLANAEKTSLHISSKDMQMKYCDLLRD